MPDIDAPDLTGCHVLLIDDNEDARTVLGSYLEHLGATVSLARNAGDALALLNDLRAHVIVSDLSMPGMDGLELLTRIRALPAEQKAPTPAIAFTGFATRENREAARRVGFELFIVKPADPLDVAMEIKRLVRQPGSSEAEQFNRPA